MRLSTGNIFDAVVRDGEGNAGGSMVDAAKAAAPPAAAPPAATPPAVTPPVAPPAATPPAEGAPPAEATPPAATAYHPEGLGDAFKGGTDKETIDKLAAHLKGLPQPPANAEDYKLELPKELEGLVAGKDDPVLPMYREIAKELGLSQAQFEGSITKLYAKMTEKGLIERPVNLSNEFAALSNGTGDRAAQIAAGQRVALDVADKIDAAAGRGLLSKETAAEIVGPLMRNAKSIRAIAALVALADKAGGLVPPTGGGGGGQDTPEQLHEKRLAALYPTMTK